MLSSPLRPLLGWTALGGVVPAPLVEGEERVGGCPGEWPLLLRVRRVPVGPVGVRP